MIALSFWLLTLWAKASVLVLSALFADLALRRAPANVRHAMWTATFVALLSLPILSAVLPDLPLAVLGSVPRVSVERAVGPGGEATGTDSTSQSTEAPPIAAVETAPTGVAAGPPMNPPIVSTLLARGAVLAGRLAIAAPVMVSMLWAMGAMAALVLVAISYRRASRVIAHARDLLDADWRTDLREARTLVRMHEAVRLRESSRITTPMAGGFRRSVVLVPEAARGWSARRRYFVLLHELAHLAHRDPMRHLVARLALVLHWPNPLVWLAGHRAIAAREEACDERVLSLGVHPPSYARELVELTALLQTQRHPGIAALPLIQRSLMEKRIVNILRDNRRPLRRPVAGALAALACAVTLSVAAAVPELAQEPQVVVTTKTDIAKELAESPGPQLAPTSLSRAEPPAAASASLTKPSDEVELGEKALLQDAERARVAAAAMGVPVFSEDSACFFDGHRDFSGSLEVHRRKLADRVVVYFEQIGVGNGDLVFVRHYDGKTVCMRTDGDVEADSERGAVTGFGSGSVVSWETQDGDTVQRLEVRAGGDYTWRIDGDERVFDAEAGAWYAGVREVVATQWEMTRLLGQAKKLGTQIASIRTERGRLRAQIWSTRDEVGSMRAEVATVLGQASGIRSEIWAIRSHVNTLRGKKAIENGAIASLLSAHVFSDAEQQANNAVRIDQHRALILLIEDEIKQYDAEGRISELEEQLNAGDFDGQVGGIEREIIAFDLAGKIARLEAEIEALDADANIARIQQETVALNAQQRVDRLQVELRASIERLERLIADTR